MTVWGWLTCQGAFCNCHRRSRLCGKPSWDVRYFWCHQCQRGGGKGVLFCKSFFILLNWRGFMTWFIPQKSIYVWSYSGSHSHRVSVAKLVPGFYQIGTWVLLNICSAWKTFPPHLSQIMYVIILWMVLLILWLKMMIEKVPWASWASLLSWDYGSVYELWSCWHRLNTVTIFKCLWSSIRFLQSLFMMMVIFTSSPPTIGGRYCKLKFCLFSRSRMTFPGHM